VSLFSKQIGVRAKNELGLICGCMVL